MVQSISVDTLVVQAKEQVSCDLAGEAAILNLANGVYYGLDPVGARIWQLIQEPRRIGAVRDLLLAEYEVDSVRCEADLIALITKLASELLIEIHDSKSA